MVSTAGMVLAYGLAVASLKVSCLLGSGPGRIAFKPSCFIISAWSSKGGGGPCGPNCAAALTAPSTINPRVRNSLRSGIVVVPTPTFYRVLGETFRLAKKTAKADPKTQNRRIRRIWRGTSPSALLHESAPGPSGHQRRILEHQVRRLRGRCVEVGSTAALAGRIHRAHRRSRHFPDRKIGRGGPIECRGRRSSPGGKGDQRVVGK